MNKKANLPIKKITDLLGYKINRGTFSLFRYKKGTDDILFLPQLSTTLSFASVDMDRELEEDAKKRIQRLRYNNTYRKTVSLISVKSLIFLYASTTNGHPRVLFFEDMARALGCTVRSVKNSLDFLSQEGMISCWKRSSGCFEFAFPNYEKMFSGLKNGGEEYITVTDEVCEHLFALDKVNDLRLALALIFASFMNSLHSSSKTLGTVVTMSELRRMLPDYIRPYTIKTSVHKLSSFLGLRLGREKTIITKLPKLFDITAVNNRIKGEARKLIRDCIRDINEAVSLFNHDIGSFNYSSKEKYKKLLEAEVDLPDPASAGPPDVPLLKLPDFDSNAKLIDALSSIATNFDVRYVLKAISIFYGSYLVRQIAVKESAIPPLITSIVKEQMDLELA